MSDRREKSQLMDNLRHMLRETIRLRREGARYPRLARAHGYVDGYMRALLEAGEADQNELLALVAEVRAATEGPATAVLSPEAAA